MLYKFKSLTTPDLSARIKTTDGDEVTVNFIPQSPMKEKDWDETKRIQTASAVYGYFETEIERIGEGMLKDKRNGVEWMHLNPVAKSTSQAKNEPAPVKEPEPEKVGEPKKENIFGKFKTKKNR